METITKQINVFAYSELSDSAKERVRQWHCETLDNQWSESAIDDAKEIAALMGWTIERVNFSGFSSQGDGAQFVGSMRYAKKCAVAVKQHAPQDVELHRIAQAWQKLQQANFYALRATVKSSGYYCHEYCTSFDCEDTRHNYGWIKDETEKQIAIIARDFMRWIYRQLEKEYDHESSAENVAELCDANEWRFLESGKFYV